MPDKDEERLSLFKENYRNLNEAFWECHKVYWQMTSIFLPLILGIMGLVLKDVDIPAGDEKITLFVFFVGTLLLLTFWFLTTEYLDEWNGTRRKRLKEIEEYFNHLYFFNEVENSPQIVLFSQYSLAYKSGFHWLTRLLYVVLFIGILLTMRLKLSP